jgi:hypothetical protein
MLSILLLSINTVNVLVRGPMARLRTLEGHGLLNTGLDAFQFHNDSIVYTELGQYYYICP